MALWWDLIAQLTGGCLPFSLLKQHLKGFWELILLG